MMKRIRALALAGLLLLNGLFAVEIANAGKYQTVEIEGVQIIPVAYDNILTSSSFSKYDHAYYFKGIQYLFIEIDGKEVMLPVDVESLAYYKDESREREYQRYLKVERLSKYFEGYKIKDIDEVMIAKEITTSKVVGLARYLGGFYPNRENFFADEIIVGGNIYDFKHFEEVFKEKAKEDKIVAKVFDEDADLSMEEIRHIYMVCFQKENWPAFFVPTVYKNSTLPNLTEEELNEKVDGKNLSLAGVLVSIREDYNDIVKWVLCYYIETESGWALYDFFSNDYITTLSTKQFEQAYIEKIGVDYKRLVTILPRYIDKSTEIIPFGIDRNIALYFNKIVTVRDAIEFYQLLPIEEQVDYSNFDFTNNPRVVPPGS